MVDMKSTIAGFGLDPSFPPAEAESPIEYLAWFRFPVTWNYISCSSPVAESEVAPRPVPASAPLTLAPRVPVPVPRGPKALEAERTEDDTRPATSAARWEMMVPKMTRPPARLEATVDAASAPALVAPVPPAGPAPTPEESPATISAALISTPRVSQFAPSFSLNNPEDHSLARRWPQIVFVAIAIAVIGGVLWGLSGPSGTAHGATSSPVKASIWLHQPASTPGRSLTLYEPSRAESAYRMEFSWIPDAAGVGWVFRTRDGNNYYAARLSLQQRGPVGVLVAEHFSVLGGAESAHSRKVIPLENPSRLLKIHMDAIGPAFKLFVEDQPADSWTDARFGTGALGFYGDGNHLPKLLALSFTFIKNPVSRTALVSLP